MSDNSAGRII